MEFYKETEFQKTETGKIPKEWSVVNLHNVVDSENDIVAGPFGSNLKVVDYRQEGVPIIRLQNIERNEFINKDIKYTSQKKAEELIYHSYKPGDIVLAKLGDPLGKTCIIPDYMEEGIVVADVVRIRISPKKTVNKFMEYILNSSICSNQLYKETIGSTRPRVNINQIRNLKIPLPSLSEQGQIASVLSDVDELIQKTDEIIQKIQLLKKGLMQELLTKGIGHKEFRYSEELGCEIPKEWGVTKIKEIADVKGGKRLPKGYKLNESKTNHPYLRVVDFKSGNINTKNLMYLDQRTYEKISRYIISSDDVYISIAGTIGLAGVIPDELDGSNLTENAAKLCNIKKYKKEFLSYVLNSRILQKQVKKFIGKGSQPKLALFRIEKLELPLPDIEEQRQIASILSKVDDQIEKESRTKAQLEKLKKGLMQLLLTGKVRVKVN